MKRRADIRAAAMARIEQLTKKPDKELAEAVRQIVTETLAELEAFKAETAQAEAERLMAKAAKPPQFPTY